MEKNINQPDNQTTQPGSEPAQIEAIGDVPCDNMSSLSTCRQLDEVGVRQIEIETNISDREIRTQLDGIRNINVDADTQTSHLLIDVTLPTDVSEQRSIQHAYQSVCDSESLRGSHTRSPDASIHETMPQLDGPVSVWSRSGRRMPENSRIEQESFQRITMSCRREYPGEGSDDAHSDRRTYGGQRPLEEGRCHGQHGRPSDMRMEVTLGEGMQIEVEDPLMMEDPLVMEGPLMMEDPRKWKVSRYPGG